MLVLAIDTTTEYGHLGLLSEKQTLLNLDCFLPLTEKLVQYLQSMFELQAQTPEALTCVGVITGPGGYTSTRIGVVVAKTISQVYSIPLIGINKIEALIYQLQKQYQGWICPVLNVRQQEVYAGIGQFQAEKIVYHSPPELYTRREWQTILAQFKEPLTIVGDGMPDLIPAQINSASLAELTHLRYIHGERTTAYDVNPFYARSPVPK